MFGVAQAAVKQFLYRTAQNSSNSLQSMVFGPKALYYESLEPKGTVFAAITRGFNVVQPVSVNGFGYWNKVFKGRKYSNVEALGP